MSGPSRTREFIRSNVIGFISLFVALGGTAWAAGQIGAGDIKDNAIRSNHIKNGQVKGEDVAEGTLDTAVLQSRVDTFCSGGQSISAIAEDGTVTCQPGGGAPTGPAGGDLDGTYPNPAIAANAVDSSAVADNSLTGTDVNEGSLDTSVLQSRVGASCPAEQSIRAIAQNGTVTCEADDVVGGSGSNPVGPAGGDLAGTYPNPTIASNAVGSAEVTDGSLATADLGVGSVTGSRIADGGIGFDDLDPLLFNDEIADNGSSQYGIAPNSVDSGEITDGTITAADLGVNSVAYSEVASSTFNSEITSTGTAYGVADNSIQSNEVTDNSLTGADIDESTLAPSIHAYFASQSGGVQINAHSGAYFTVISKNVPAGTYLGLAGTSIYRGGSGDTQTICAIFAGGTRVGTQASVNIEDSNNGGVPTANLSTMATFTLDAASTVALRCYAVNPDALPSAYATNIAAIPLGGLN